MGFPTEGSSVSKKSWALALAVSHRSNFSSWCIPQVTLFTGGERTDSLCHSNSLRETGSGQREGDHKRALGQGNKEVGKGRAPRNGHGDIPNSPISRSFSPASVVPQISKPWIKSS